MQVIKRSCMLTQVTYKHALTHATSRQTLGFNIWNRRPVDECLRQVNGGGRAEKTPAVRSCARPVERALRLETRRRYPGRRAEGMLSVRSCLPGRCYRVEGNMLQHV